MLCSGGTWGRGQGSFPSVASHRKNLAIARRETYLPGTGDLAYRVVCEDFREHAPGLFLPNRIVVDSGMPTSTTPNGPLFRVEEYRLTEVALNPSIETGAFEIEFPPGTLVDDRIAGIEYRVDKPATVTEALEEDVDRFQSRMGMAKDSPEEVDSISPMAASKVRLHVLVMHFRLFSQPRRVRFSVVLRGCLHAEKE